MVKGPTLWIPEMVFVNGGCAKSHWFTIIKRKSRKLRCVGSDRQRSLPIGPVPALRALWPGLEHS